MTTIDLRNGENIGLVYNLREDFYWQFSVTDQDDSAVDLSGKTIVMSIRSTDNGTAIDTAEVGDGLTISTDTITIDKQFTGLSTGVYHYDVMNMTDDRCIADGRLVINYGGR